MLVFTLVFGAVDAGVADSFGDGKACEDAGDADLHELHRGAEHGAHLHAEGPATGSEPNDGGEDGGRGGEALQRRGSLFGPEEGPEGGNGVVA